MDREDTRRRLITTLRSAYSGERAAALAYRAHASALSNPRERAAIENIEREEWAHRADVGELLAALGARPAPLREAVMAALGRGVGVTCHFGSWIVPMYFAGRIEHSNIIEYDDAARCARELGLLEHERRLSAMAATEREHEAFFLQTVAAHPWLPILKRLFHWG